MIIKSYPLASAATPEAALEAQRLLRLEGENVFVEDYTLWEKAESGLMPLAKAEKHPAARLLLGGSERAEEYLETYHLPKFGEKIVIWKANDPAGVARLGLFGNNFNNNDLNANN